MEASHRLLYVSFKSYSQHLDNIKRNFCSFITTFLWVTEVCVYFRECVLTGGHLQMKPCGVLLATAQVPPLRQGLLLQPSNTVSQRWPTEVSHKKVCHFIFIPHYNCKVNVTPVRFRSTNTVYKRCAAAGTDSCILHHCNLIFTWLQ